MNVTFRAGKGEDTEACGIICYQAFKAIADQHNFPPDFSNSEQRSPRGTLRYYKV